MRRKHEIKSNMITEQIEKDQLFFFFFFILFLWRAFGIEEMAGEEAGVGQGAGSASVSLLGPCWSSQALRVGKEQGEQVGICRLKKCFSSHSHANVTAMKNKEVQHR